MSDFASAIIRWQRTHGRHHLPWQNTRDPYAIWVSEIMLQQTQVTAVMAYYRKFMQRFPDIASLAAAEQELVLQYWSGLGYYSRARNLHNAAQIIMHAHGGCFPQDFSAMQALPGIGRSTAAAIASFAFGQAQPILDGNVKRVFARHFLIEGWPGLSSVEKRLWVLAESLMPASGVAAYTQGLMDLGATLCSRSQPQCERCPLMQSCAARVQQRVREFPAAKPRKVLPEKQIILLLLLAGDEILLERRPPSGIWGGLWSLPEAASDQQLASTVRARYGLEAEMLSPLPGFTHSFSHFRLHITPQPLRVLRQLPEARQSASIWLTRQEAIDAALPTPVRNILRSMSPSMR